MWSWESSKLIQNLYWNLVLILSFGWFYLSRGVGNKIVDSKCSSSMTLGLKKILLRSLVSWFRLILVSSVNLSKNQNGSKLVLFHLHYLLESYSRSKCWWATPSCRWTPPHLTRLLLFFYCLHLWGAQSFTTKTDQQFFLFAVVCKTWPWHHFLKVTIKDWILSSVPEKANFQPPSAKNCDFLPSLS